MTDDIPTEALDAAAFALWRQFNGGEEKWAAAAEATRSLYYVDARAILAAAAPHLIAEGRRQGELHALKAAEEAILSERRPDPVLDSNGVVLAAAVVRRMAARIAEGTTHG